GCGTEGICCTENNFAVFSHQYAGELPRSGCLTDTIDSDNHDDSWFIFLASCGESAVHRWVNHGNELFAKHRPNGFRVASTFDGHAFLKTVHQFHSWIRA